MLDKQLRSLQIACERIIKMKNLTMQQPSFENVTIYPPEYRECVTTIRHLLGVRATAAIVKASASSICRWGKRIGRIFRDDQKSMISEIMIDAIKQFMLGNPSTKAKDVKQFIKYHFNINVSRQLVQVVISKRLGMSYKRTRKRGRTMEEDVEYTSKRDNFVSRLKGFSNSNIVSIDESGFDERVKPVYSYALKGLPAIAYQPKIKVSDHTRTSLLMAIASDGSRIHELHKNSINGEAFADFILSLPYSSGTAIILDNHSMHDIESVQVAMLVKGYEPLFIPPHSPEFNPIEMFFGTTKNDFYNFRYSDDFSTVRNAIEMLINKHGNVENIKAYFRHIFDFMATIVVQTHQEQYPNTNSERRWDGMKTLKHIANKRIVHKEKLMPCVQIEHNSLFH